MQFFQMLVLRHDLYPQFAPGFWKYHFECDEFDRLYMKMA